MSTLVTPRSARSTATVPFLPGNSGSNFKPNHHKTQSLVYGAGGALVSPRWDILKPGPNGAVPKLDMTVLEQMKDPAFRLTLSNRSMTHEERSALRESARNSFRPAMAPTWLKHDRQVLRFSAYFKEPVHDNPKENFRVRCCLIFFYLDDGTLMVCEPKEENSGIPQGKFIKRHRVPRPDGGYYKPEDLQCGTTVVFYSRAFRIVNCDAFTEAFYKEALGMSVGEKETIPSDSWRVEQSMAGPAGVPLRTMTRDMKESKEFIDLFLGGGRKNNKLQQFLENDRKVLSFKCYWDDTTHYGERLYYDLHYYLADDTVEMLEALPSNSGRDPYPAFWKKGPLPKNPYFVAVPGLLAPDPINYKPEDLMVGSCIEVFGRKVFLYDCDDFTRDFFRKYMSHEQPTIDLPKVEHIHPQLSPPPHTGIGSEEDSLANVLSLEPRPPRRDEVKLMEQASLCLRFQAQIVQAKPEDEKRRFVVVVYVSDDAVAVWEGKQRNSGRTEGRFAMRGKKKNPITGGWYKQQDFFVGAVVEISGLAFHLISAEEPTLKFMEEHAKDYPVANVSAVAAKLQGLQAELSKKTSLSPDELCDLAEAHLGVSLTDHEVITLSRSCSESPGSLATSKLLAAMGSA
mmetsp:Transcript_31178/g.72663  ORF Transcript_31178/g.72663 Transcript_31178/m.72663 type:complete len:626 (+) Transcript_31178:102-1979(+)